MEIFILLPSKLQSPKGNVAKVHMGSGLECDKRKFLRKECQ